MEQLISLFLKIFTNYIRSRQGGYNFFIPPALDN